MKSTVIYWLLDVRPETIAAGWHSGYPFYCGKTINAEKRFSAHYAAARLRPNRMLSRRISTCGQHVRFVAMETISPNCSWQHRECHWIEIIRFSFPDGNCNIADGGRGGMGGRKRTRAERATLRRAHRNSARCKDAAVRRRINRYLKKHDPIEKMRKRIRRHKMRQRSLRG